MPHAYSGPHMLMVRNVVQVFLPMTQGQNSFGEPGWFVNYPGSAWHGYVISAVVDHYEAEGFTVTVNYEGKTTNSATATLEPRTMRRRIHIPGITNVAPPKEDVQASAQADAEAVEQVAASTGRLPFLSELPAPLPVLIEQGLEPDNDMPINARIAMALGWPSVWQDPRPGRTTWFMERPDPNRPGHNIVEIVPDYIATLQQHFLDMLLVNGQAPTPGRMTREEFTWASRNNYVEQELQAAICTVTRLYQWREFRREIGQRFIYE